MVQEHACSSVLVLLSPFQVAHRFLRGSQQQHRQVVLFQRRQQRLWSQMMLLARCFITDIIVWLAVALDLASLVSELGTLGMICLPQLACRTFDVFCRR